MILSISVASCLAVIVPVLGIMLCCCWCNDKSHNSRKDTSETVYTTTASSLSPRSAALVSTSSSSSGTGRHKKRSKYKIETQCDAFNRTVTDGLMFIVLLLMSFFVICAFVTNEYVQNGARKLPAALNQSLDEVGLYLNNTQTEVNTLLRTNFEQLQNDLSSNLDKSGFIIQHRLAVYSRAIALDNLTQIVTSKSTYYI